MARSTISFEWTINTCEGNRVAYGLDAGDVEWDVIDNNFSNELSGFSAAEVAQINGEEYQLELWRHTHDSLDNLKERLYASVEVLPDNTLKIGTTFDDGTTKVPARFHSELAKLNARRKVAVK